MRATELKVGEHYYVSYRSVRNELLAVGQGHGDVHRMRELHPVTSEPMKDEAGLDKTFTASSRDIARTTKEHLLQHPNYIDNWLKAQEREQQNKQERDDRAATLQFLKDVCEETAGLLSALGFEAKVTDARYDPKGATFPYQIVISNPTEHQDLLRRMIAEKWGVSPAARQGSPVTGNEYLTETKTLPEDQ